LPGQILLAVFLVYPAVATAILSLRDARSAHFVGLDNYRAIFGDPSMRMVLRNNLLWLVVFTGATVLLGLVLAALSDRVRYRVAVQAAVFLPMAISFVAAGVIWKFMYQFQPAGTPQVGAVNALLTAVDPHFTPRAWLFDQALNDWALIAVGIWMWTGFATVILSAGLQSIPESLAEAARLEGAGELRVFLSITLPLVMPTVTVVATTLVITVLKIFDIVYVMTSGNLGTDVIANRMYKELFNFQSFGRASALATVLLLAIAPVLVMNVRRFGRKGGA
jgi:alpha-glucoside transport system permease protein